MPPKNARCPYCSKSLPSQNAVRLHVSATPSCNETWKKQFSQPIAKPLQHLPSKPAVENSSSSSCNLQHPPTDDEMDTFADNFDLPSTSAAPSEAIGEDVAGLSSGPNNFEVEVQGHRFIEQYPRSIANPIGCQKTRFEQQCDEEKTNGKLPWEPFSSQDEWELARWLINNVNQKATEKYLKLPIVSSIELQGIKFLQYIQVQKNEKMSFSRNYQFTKMVDKLPTGPGWTCEIIHLEGEEVGEDGRTLVEDLELWRRDPVECVKELIGNPAFKEYISYVPERVYTDNTGQDRVYDEMWSADWWWETQVS